MCILIIPRFLTEDWFLIALTKNKQKKVKLQVKRQVNTGSTLFSFWFLQHNNFFYFARIKISLYSNSFISSFHSPRLGSFGLLHISFPYHPGSVSCLQQSSLESAGNKSRICASASDTLYTLTLTPVLHQWFPGCIYRGELAKFHPPPFHQK